MKKTVIRVFSMLLTLVMLIGMTAAAETQKITIDVNGYDGTKLDGVLSIGYDEDGCEQYSFENSMLGKFVLQSDGNDLVFGGDQIGYYTVSAQDLTDAITKLVSMIVSQQLGAEFMNVVNYLNSISYQQDAQIAGEILAGEVNRLASLAAEMGLVVIHENGDLEISANVQNVFMLVSEYLESLSKDTAALNAFANLEIFKVMGVPMAENAAQLPAILMDAANQVEAARISAKDVMDGGLELYVSAENGTLTGKYYTATKVNGQTVYEMTESFSVNADGSMLMDVVINADGGVIKYSYALAGNSISYELSADAAGQSVRAAFTLDENGLVAEAVANTTELSGEGKIVVNAGGIDGKWDFAGEYLTFNGAINYDPANEELLYKINYADAYTTLKANVEYADEELYAEMTKTERGQIVADFTVSGSSTYRIKGTWVSGYQNCSLNATLRMKNVGPELEGTLNIGSASYEFIYAQDSMNDTTEFAVTMVEGNSRQILEVRTSSDGRNERLYVGYSVKYGSSVNKFTAAVNYDNIEDIISGEFEIDENGSKTPGSFVVNENGFEVKFSDESMSYRIYAEGVKDYADITVKAGLSGEEIANPGNIMDAILFVFNANTMNGLTFDAVLNTMMGYYGSFAFDGQSIKLDVSANGETVTMEGKIVETDSAQYIEFAGFVSGMPFEARAGIRMEDVLCLFAEALVNGEKMLDVEAHLIQGENEIAVEVMGDSLVIDGEKIIAKAGMFMESEETIRLYGEITGEVPSHKMGLYLPVTFVETYTGAFVSASLSMAQGDQTMEIGNASFSYETVSNGGAHVEGERLTSDMLVEMILSMIGMY